MFKKYRFIKWISLFVIFLLVITASFIFWLRNVLPPRETNLEATQAADISYLSENIIPNRGKILAVVTSTDIMGTSGKTTGYELTELARAYYVFEANGFEVDIASPKGGKPPVVIDDEDMGVYDYAFLNDSKAQYKTSHTIPMNKVASEEYAAIYFVGGKGTMFDFPDNKAIQSIVKEYYQTNKVIGAVCHGPSAFVNVILDNGQPLLKGKTVSSFTNEEELLLISDAKSIFPFLLQDKIIAQGARFNEGALYLDKISHDKNLITGQNPWSTWSVSEKMIAQLGYTPKSREITGEENSVKVLIGYKNEGKQKAKEMIELLIKDQKSLDRILLAKHGIIAAMRADVSDFVNLLSLVSFAKNCESKKIKI